MTAADHTVCFTGHRPKSIFPINPYDESRRKDYQKIVDRIADFVCSMYNKGFTKYISGGAQGFDQLAFWAVLSTQFETRRIILLMKDNQRSNDFELSVCGYEKNWMIEKRSTAWSELRGCFL